MAGKGKFGDLSGNGKLGMDDIVALVIGGIVGYIGIFIAGMISLLDKVDPQTGLLTAVIVVLTTGIVKSFGIGK